MIDAEYQGVRTVSKIKTISTVFVVMATFFMTTTPALANSCDITAPFPSLYFWKSNITSKVLLTPGIPRSIPYPPDPVTYPPPPGEELEIAQWGFNSNNSISNFRGVKFKGSFVQQGSGNPPPQSHQAIFWSDTNNFDGNEFGFVASFNGRVRFYQCGDCNQAGLQRWTETGINVSFSRRNQDMWYTVELQQDGDFRVKVVKASNNSVLFDSVIPKANWLPNLYGSSLYHVEVHKRADNSNFTGSSVNVDQIQLCTGTGAL